MDNIISPEAIWEQISSPAIKQKEACKMTPPLGRLRLPNRTWIRKWPLICHAGSATETSIDSLPLDNELSLHK